MSPGYCHGAGRQHDGLVAKTTGRPPRKTRRGTRGQRLLRQRGEWLERPFAHLFETGRLRRTHLRGHPNILKRLLVHVGAFNLGLLMRQLTGVGTPRSLQGRAPVSFAALIDHLSEFWTLVQPWWVPDPLAAARIDSITRPNISTRPSI